MAKGQNFGTQMMMYSSQHPFHVMTAASPGPSSGFSRGGQEGHPVVVGNSDVLDTSAVVVLGVSEVGVDDSSSVVVDTSPVVELPGSGVVVVSGFGGGQFLQTSTSKRSAGALWKCVGCILQNRDHMNNSGKITVLLFVSSWFPSKIIG